MTLKFPASHNPVAMLSDYAPVSPEARATFASLEGLTKEVGRCFLANHTTTAARKRAIATLYRIERLAVEARKELRA